MIPIAAMSTALGVDCEAVAKSVTKRISDDPARLLAIVNEEVGKNTSCVCEIVKAAIDAAGADKEDVRDIVSTAAAAAPDEAATIVECAIAQAPDAAREIKAAMDEVFEGADAAQSASKQPVDGKQPVGKQPVHSAKEIVVDDSPDYGPAPVTVSGVYLMAPVAPSGGGPDIDLKKLSKELGIPEDKLVELLHNGDKVIEVLRRRGHKRPGDDDETTPNPQTY